MDFRVKSFIVIILGLLAVFPAEARERVPPLDACIDPVLQEGLNECLVTLGLTHAAQRKSLGVAVVDMTNPTSPRIASVNGDHMMYAASLPKIAILLGAFERIAEGRLTLDKEIRDSLTNMIRHSSNQAATEMLQRVGESYVEKTLQSNRYRLYDPAKNGGLWVGKGYGKVPAWKRDPLHNLSHGATAFQVARFYYMLQNGTLVSPEMSRQMKLILGKPAIHHKFVKGLEAAHRDARIYRKSGTWRQYHSDSAIVERGDRRYIAVALAKSPNGEKWLRDIIVALDDLISLPYDKPE
ncbi:class A beta-lactamase-related serine hydrolase [bacterium]|nr:class A beta-lactamase-related serine hydrolase [bacterium]